MDKKSISPEHMEQAYAEAQIRVLAARDGSEQLDHALIYRSAISDLMVKYGGYTLLEVELLLLKINEKLN